MSRRNLSPERRAVRQHAAAAALELGCCAVHGCDRAPSEIIDPYGHLTERLVLAGWDVGCAIPMCALCAELWRTEVWPRGKCIPEARGWMILLSYLAHGPRVLEQLRWWGEEDVDPDHMLARYGLSVRR